METRKIRVLKTNEIKDFRDLKMGDKFEIVNDDTCPGKFECKSDTYLNEDSVVTIKADRLLEDGNKIMSFKKNLLSGNEMVTPKDRINVILDSGELKCFIELQPGDIFQRIDTDGNVEYSKDENGKNVSWVKCESKPYLNEHSIATIRASWVYEEPKLR